MFGMGCMCWVLVQSFGRGLNTAYLLRMLGMGFMCWVLVQTFGCVLNTFDKLCLVLQQEQQ